MANPPASAPPSYSELTSPRVEASDRELFELLQKALEPSFVLVRRVGAGGMGVVYLARDPALKRLVAVKLLSPDRVDASSRARFQREAQAVAAISHPNVVAVHSVGELSNGVPYMVMQYVEGASMAERIAAEGPLDLETTRQILGQVASALAAAHRKGIVHRDIKAANIFWDDAAGKSLVGDFGIAAVMSQSKDDGTLTQTGMMVGTPRYMSPEQFLGEEATPKTDMYALGLLAYELLTGDGPYDLSSPKQIAAAHLTAAPKDLTIQRPDIDAELAALLRQCLEKDPEARPDAEDVARRLARAETVLLEWPPPGLEPIHGTLHRAATSLLVGGYLIAAPFALAGTTQPNDMLLLNWPQSITYPLVGSIGILSLITAARWLDRIGRHAARAAFAGYGWGTILEVVADERRDTGALICAEREYATLPAAERDRLRRNRVLSQLLRVGAGLCAASILPVGLPLTLLSGARPGWLAAYGLVLPLLMMLASWTLEGHESRLLRGTRERLGKSHDHVLRMAGLVAAWQGSFTQAIAGLKRGQGLFGWPRSGRVTSTVAAFSIVIVGVATVFTLAMPLIYQLFARYAQADPQTAISRGDLATHNRYRSAADPAITPRMAGEAMLAMSASEPAERWPGPSPAARKPSAVIDHVAPMPPGWGPFSDHWELGMAVRQAARGLNAEQLRFLAAAAERPGIAEFETVARAGAVDFLSAATVDPLPPGFSAWMAPAIQTGPLEKVAASRIAQAALDLAAGRPLEAERRLREVMSFGLAMRQTHSMEASTKGMGVMTRARRSLIALYEATGRTAEAKQLADVDARTKELLWVQFEQPTQMSQSPRVRAGRRQSILIDTTIAAAVRWHTAARATAFAPCADLRQMLFGPDDEYRRELAMARRTLVRVPGDELLMRAIETALDRPPTYREPVDRPPLPIRALAGALDQVTESHRFSACLINPDFLNW